jgi:hypothetical protein
VLKMPDRIAEESAVARSGHFQNPNEGRIGRRMPFQHTLIHREIRHPCLVELENRLRRLASLPL